MGIAGVCSDCPHEGSFFFWWGAIETIKKKHEDKEITGWSIPSERT